MWELLLQLVQSRTFGAAGKRRELVRMLVPLVDFFNHRGDESAGPLGQSIFAGENARSGPQLGPRGLSTFTALVKVLNVLDEPP